MPLQQSRIVVLLTLIVLSALASRASAQIRFGRDLNRSDPLQGVYVRDSAVVDEKFALAQRLERLKEWDKSADVYQEIVEKFSDRVVLVSSSGGGGDDDAAKALPRYASVSFKVQELLGKWPDEGLKRYRARYEASAASLLEAAGQDDVAALSRVMQRYFATDAAKTAGFRLIELYIENGEFPAAAWVGERMLAYHPGVTDADRPRLLFRTALAEHLNSDDVAAKRNADELSTRFGAATGTWHGEEVVLSAEMAKILSGPAAVARGGLSPDVWPTFGGDASRSRIPAAAARPSARLPGTIELRPPVNAVGARAAAAAQNSDVNTERSLRDQGAYLNIMPAVDRGEVFFQDGQRLYAKGLESGLTLPGWTTYAGVDEIPAAAPRRGPVAVNGSSIIASSGAQYTVTLTDTSVLAVLRFVRIGPGHDPSGNLQQTVSTPLVCHDRVTGAQRWSISPSQFAQQNLRDLELGGAPLIVGDNVYVGAHGGQAQGTENAHVLCFGLRDGKLKWSCYLASSSGFAGNAGMPGSSAVSHLSYAGGRIYAVTNLGAVAAVDAYSGTIVWLTLYPRATMNFNMGGGGAVIMSSGKPWSQNPAIVKDGKVFCLPSDSQFVYIYDAGTGAEIKRIGVAGDLDNANTLLGVMGDRLVLNSLNKVFCLNWVKYPEPTPDYWTSTMAGSGALEKEVKDTIRGRGFVTADSVFIPTLWDLRRIKLDGGKLEGRYPQKGDWTKDEGPGNVLVTSDQVIVAGIYNLNVYSDLGLAQAKLDREVQANPNDPLPRLKYAETLFAAGQIAGAMEKLDQAIDLLGGLNAMRPGSLRERVFARSLAFAERSWDPQVGMADIARANALYDRASAAAFSPQQQVTYRLSRARFADKQRDWPTEARLNQEILGNPAWRTAMVSGSPDSSDGYGAGVKPAYIVAEGNIAHVIEMNRDAYAPFEKAAGDALAAAQAHNDPPAMLAVAQTYPNAQAAPLAMLSAAQAFEDAKNSREATRVLAEAFRKYHDKNDDPTKALILEAQARNYLLLPGAMGTAIGRMHEGMKLPGIPKLSKPLKLPTGDAIVDAGTAFGDAAYMLQLHTKRAAQAALPDFNLPRPTPGKPVKFVPAFAPEAPETIIADCDQLLLPPRELRDRTRLDRVVTWTRDKGVSVYATGGTAPLGTAAVGDNKTAPRGAIWFGNDLVVWTTDTVTLLKGDALAAGWSVALSTMEMPDVVEPDGSVIRNAPPTGAQPGDGDPAMPRVLRGGPGFIIRGNARIAIGPAGVVAPQPAPRAAQGAPAEQLLFLRPVGDRAVFATNYARIAAIDTASGQIAWQTRIADSLSDKDQVLANDDFLATRFGTPEGARIVALDAYAGQIVFGDSPGNDLPPQNLALSPDGLLVYTLPDRVRVKDLFEPGKELKFKDAPLADPGSNNRPFENCVGPDQLVVAEGRILALAERGQFVWVLSADDGRKVDMPLRLSTGAKPDTYNVAIRMIGTHLYIFSEHKPQSIELDDREPKDPYSDLPADRIVTDAFVGKQHLVLITTLRPADPQPGFKKDKQFKLLAFARYPSRPDRNDESGRLDHDPSVVYPTEITQWQPVEGGFYYRGADRRAHFLKGAGTPIPPNPLPNGQ